MRRPCEEMQRTSGAKVDLIGGADRYQSRSCEKSAMGANTSEATTGSSAHKQTSLASNTPSKCHKWLDDIAVEAAKDDQLKHCVMSLILRDLARRAGKVEEKAFPYLVQFI